MAPPAFAVMVATGSCDTLGALLEEQGLAAQLTNDLALPPTVVLRELGSHGKSLVAASLLPAAAAVIEAEAPLLKVSRSATADSMSTAPGTPHASSAPVNEYAR
jgi:hypothetical protein